MKHFDFNTSSRLKRNKRENENVKLFSDVVKDMLTEYDKNLQSNNKNIENQSLEIAIREEFLLD